MSGINLGCSRHPSSLIKGRLGIFEKPEFKGDPNVAGVNDQYTRLSAAGGSLQQQRMIRDKRKSLDRALWFSYQGAMVRLVDSENLEPARALINANKLKQDYDDKILSIGFEHGFQPGDVFEWIGTKTYWLIYLQELTELAYFRGSIRKCSYQVEWLDGDSRKKVYAAIRGPVETKINYVQKHQISIDTPNYSLDILMPKTEDTLKYFKRYAKFYLQDADIASSRICWRVEAVDSISMPGIVEVVAVEYFSNKDEDDVENGLVGGLVPIPSDPNDKTTEDDLIIGETFIKPKRDYKYQFVGNAYGEWYIENKYPIDMKICEEDNSVTLKWRSGYSGQFDLYYGYDNADLYIARRTIVVQSLF